MMVNQTAETLKPKEKESTFYTGIGLGLYSLSPSLKFQFGYQQRFGLSDNIEFQFFLYNDIDLAAIMHLSTTLKIAPKFRIYHNDKYDLSLLPSVGIYHVLEGFMVTRYLGPFTGLTIISSHKIKKDRLTIYYGLGAEVGESFLRMFDLLDNYQNRFENMVIDLSLSTSFGLEVLKYPLVTRHELGVTTSFDIEKNSFYSYSSHYYDDSDDSDNIGIDRVLVTVYYGFSIGGRYPRQTIEQ